MLFGLQCFLLLITASSLLALPLRGRREDNFEVSLERSSRDATEITMNEESTLFEGDIKLSEGQESPYSDIVKRDAGSSGDGNSVTPPNKDSAEEAFKSRSDLWENGKVYYKLDTILTPMYRTLYKDAMKWWTDATEHDGGSCITFIEAVNDETDYLLLRKVGEDDGCSSYIGRQGGEQFVNISSSCSSVGSAAHELGHALGLWHEQSRPDRDMYINVMHENIISPEIEDKNFGILSESTFSQVPPVSYDIESIMHYGKQAFTKDQSLNTIEVRDDAEWDMCDDPTQMGQRTKISHKDALRIKLLYGCGDVTPNDMPESCEQPTPTPTLTPTSSPTPTPTSTKKIETNNVITLQFADKKFGVKCLPLIGCSPTPCTAFGGGLGSCSHIESQFRIIKPGETRIGDSDKVLLRSVDNPSMWLNCSGIRKECTITECTSNAADPSNSSYISDCKDHFFIIKGVNRSPGKVLSTRHKIQFKSYEDDTYMNCVEKKCQMFADGACPNKTKTPTNREYLINDPLKDGTSCNIQYFNVTKGNQN